MAGPKSKPENPLVPGITEQMRAFSAALEGELLTWPGVVVKPMFGMTALYRKNAIFAALPKSRALWTPASVAIKFDGAAAELNDEIRADKRFARISQLGRGWHAYELKAECDVNGALRWLSEAFELARPTSAAARPKKKKAKAVHRKGRAAG
jgi:hypothetical protein